MARFTLVVATLGRTRELNRFLDSVVRQNRADLEVIVVDQNDDERVRDVLSSFAGVLQVKHIRRQEKNVSAARNAGLDAASGEIVAFPDDDCWYPDGLLDGVEDWLERNQEYAVLAVGSLDDEGLPSGNRWVQSACDINALNALRTTFCSSLFITAIQASQQVRFDEQLCRGEETDFILRLLATGLLGRFDRTLHVHHPRRDMLSGPIARNRALSYGAGMGRLVRRHSPFPLWLALLFYDLVRVLGAAISGRFTAAEACLAHAEGLFRGFVRPRSDL
jgi:glycosyltransferase involved in cell wall biosynthesis